MKLLKIKESAQVVYNNGDRSGNFYLDFNNPGDLYREIENNCGYDFTTQFKDEFEHWKEIEVDEVKESWEMDMTDVRDLSKESLDIVNKLISLVDVKSKNANELIDAIDSLKESIVETKTIADDFFKYGLGSK